MTDDIRFIQLENFGSVCLDVPIIEPDNISIYLLFWQVGPRCVSDIKSSELSCMQTQRIIVDKKNRRGGN